MKRIFLEALPIFLFLVVGCLADEKFSNPLLTNDSVFQVQVHRFNDISPYKRRVTIAPNTNAVFQIVDTSSSSAFVLFQIHTYQYNVTLSYNKNNLNKVSNETVFGSNIGLFMRPNLTVSYLYVRNDNAKEVSALLVAIAYSDKVPVPGGCNMEFNTKVAPYINAYIQDVMVFVDLQPASIPFKNNESPSCTKPVNVDIYWMRLSEQDFSVDSYFVAISDMLTVDNIMENGIKVEAYKAVSWMRQVFNAYIGVGTVYVAVATYGDYSAAYVPTFSYGCSPIVDPDSCEILPTSFAKFISAMCFIFGLCLTLCFHCFITIKKTLPILYIGTVIGYGCTDSIGIGLLIGIGIATIWLFCAFYNPLIANCFFSLSVGLFICAMINVNVTNDIMYWLLFAGISICLSVITLPFFMFHGFLSYMFSSFMIVLSLDYWIGSSLKYITINILRRATVTNFNRAIIDTPCQAKDVCMIVLWICLTICGSVMHSIKNLSEFITIN